MTESEKVLVSRALLRAAVLHLSSYIEEKRRTFRGYSIASAAEVKRQLEEVLDGPKPKANAQGD